LSATLDVPAVLPNAAAPGLGGSPRVREVLARAGAGGRLSREDGLVLFREATLLEAGGAADAVRRRLHPPGRVTYQVDRNINYTNVCIYRCAFCAFYRPAGDAEGYVLSFEEIGKKVEETIALGGTGILLQGGVHAELPFSFYEELLSFLRTSYPRVHRHAFSAPEIHFLAKKEKTEVSDVLTRLQKAGMQSLPGGGAEILEDEVRKRIWALTKAPTEKWAEVHRAAHRLGMPTTATMMFGVGETHEQRLHHFDVVRRAQDESLAEGGESFTAFIPWTFQEENTALDGRVETAGGADYLRTLAIARLYLDNVPHVQGSWLTQGANRMAGEGAMRALIEGSGFTPVKRGSVYERCREACCRDLPAL